MVAETPEEEREREREIELERQSRKHRPQWSSYPSSSHTHHHTASISLVIPLYHSSCRDELSCSLYPLKVSQNSIKKHSC